MNSEFFSSLQSNLNGYGGGAAGDVASTAYKGIKSIAGIPIWLLKLIFGKGDKESSAQKSWMDNLRSGPMDRRSGVDAFGGDERLYDLYTRQYGAGDNTPNWNTSNLGDPGVSPSSGYFGR